MSKPIVLVTSNKLSDAAKEILRDAGADVIYMDDPINEETLLAKFAAADINAVLLRASPPCVTRWGRTST